jgi:hypothetical protein
MNNTYVENKDLNDIDHSWRIWINKLRYVDVYIWKTVVGLHKNTHFRNKNYIGAYVGHPNRKRSGLFGEIHLVKEEIGAGYVAHEIMHLVFDWMVEHNMCEFHYGKSLNERTAYLTSDITTQFWDSFYEFYDVVPSINSL